VLKVTDQMLALTYRSAEGEEGFPGNLDIELVYEWASDNTLRMRYHAVTDKPTLVNLSNHSYFNLSGEGAATILDHRLKIDADAFTPVNATLIPVGELTNVVDTPFDFSKGMSIGQAIEANNEQLHMGKGYDHNFVLRDDASPAVELSSPETGINMKITTDRPGIQFYSGNFLDGSRTGKSGKPYVHRSAVALEPQGFPDAIHHPQFPSVVLKPGEVYYSVSEYQFSKS
jgi:aldose 1-epimerase